MVKDITETGITTNLSYKSIKEANNLIFELNAKTIIDDLTGCYNRRYINERLPSDIYNAAVNDEKLSVMMLDIDFFKRTNDTYGHLAGDKVLKELCNVIRTKIRDNFDWLARFGGEEFLIILPNTDINAAYETAERIRSAWESKVVRHERHLIRTTISIGSYTANPGCGSFEKILEMVDKNLYKAKNSGRNRTEAS
ncbi:MAG: GGDEF domain-containing protein [Lachnospiraceae bacterium]|nr:GGDEF domain-containing protein [Lachnospiraceae bacterium]